MIDQNEIKSAFNHFVMGWHFITQKGLRRFVIMPILLTSFCLQAYSGYLSHKSPR